MVSRSKTNYTYRNGKYSEIQREEEKFFFFFYLLSPLNRSSSNVARHVKRIDAYNLKQIITNLINELVIILIPFSESLSQVLIQIQGNFAPLHEDWKSIVGGQKDR